MTFDSHYGFSDGAIARLVERRDRFSRSFSHGRVKLAWKVKPTRNPLCSHLIPALQRRRDGEEEGIEVPSETLNFDFAGRARRESASSTSNFPSHVSYVLIRQFAENNNGAVVIIIFHAKFTVCIHLDASTRICIAKVSLCTYKIQNLLRNSTVAR